MSTSVNKQSSSPDSNETAKKSYQVAIKKEMDALAKNINIPGSKNELNKLQSHILKLATSLYQKGDNLALSTAKKLAQAAKSIDSAKKNTDNNIKKVGSEAEKEFLKIKDSADPVEMLTSLITIDLQIRLTSQILTTRNQTQALRTELPSRPTQAAASSEISDAQLNEKLAGYSLSKSILAISGLFTNVSNSISIKGGELQNHNGKLTTTVSLEKGSNKIERTYSLVDNSGKLKSTEAIKNEIASDLLMQAVQAKSFLSASEKNDARNAAIYALRDTGIKLSDSALRAVKAPTTSPTQTPASSIRRRPSAAPGRVRTRPTLTQRAVLSENAASKWLEKYTKNNSDGSKEFTTNSGRTLGDVLKGLHKNKNGHEIYVSQGKNVIKAVFDSKVGQYFKAGEKNKKYSNRIKFYKGTKFSETSFGNAPAASVSGRANDTVEAVSEKLDVSQYQAKLTEFLKRQSSYNITEIKFKTEKNTGAQYKGVKEPHQLNLESVTVKSSDGKQSHRIDFKDIKLALYKPVTWGEGGKVLTVKAKSFKDVLNSSTVKTAIETAIRKINTGNKFNKKVERVANPNSETINKIKNPELRNAVSALDKTVKISSYQFNDYGENKIAFTFSGKSYEVSSQGETLGAVANKLNNIAKAFTQHKTLLDKNNVDYSNSVIDLTANKAEYQLKNPNIKIAVNNLLKNVSQLGEVLKTAEEVKKINESLTNHKITTIGRWPSSLKDIQSKIVSVKAMLKSFEESIAKVAGGISRSATKINLDNNKMEIDFKGKKDGKDAEVKLTFIYDEHASGVNSGHARVENGGPFATKADVKKLQDYIQSKLAVRKAVQTPTTRPAPKAVQTPTTRPAPKAVQTPTTRPAQRQ